MHNPVSVFKAGVNISNLAVDEDEIDDSQNKTGFTAGLVLRMNLLDEWLYLQREALYTVKGATYEAGSTEVDASLHYVDIPVVAGLKILNGPLSVHLGPQFSLITKAKYEYDDDSLFSEGTVVDEDRDNFEKWDFGFVAGLGLQLNKVQIDARYSRGLRSIEADRTVLGNTFAARDVQNYGFQVTGTWFF